MKNEILKKTLIYRGLAFVVGMMIALLMTGSIVLGLMVGFVSETASLTTYYIFELSWRKYIKHKKLKAGMGLFMLEERGRYNWYEVVEVLEDNKIVIKVV